MSKRIISKVGDVIAIPLGEDSFALTAITYVSKYFKNCIAIGVFPNLLREPAVPSDMPSEFAIHPLFVGKQLVTAGVWPRVGHVNLQRPFDSPPEFLVADHVFHGDTPTRVATLNDIQSLPKLLAHGCVALQDRLREHFRLPQ